MDIIDRMLEHDRWATTHLLSLCAELTDEQLDRDFDIGHRTLRETFDHYIHVIAFWTALMQGQPDAVDRLVERRRLSIAQISERHERFHDEFAAFARQARDDGRLGETFQDHYGMPPSIGGTIIQVPMHNEVHRSEIVHMLTRLGHPEQPPEVDHLLWEHVINGRTTP